MPSGITVVTLMGSIIPTASRNEARLYAPAEV